jgi:hypothetical protein
MIGLQIGVHIHRLTSGVFPRVRHAKCNIPSVVGGLHVYRGLGELRCDSKRVFR